MKLFQKLQVFILLTNVLLIGACSSSDEPDFSNNPRKSVELSRAELTCCEQMNDFNIEIIKAASGATRGNAVLSPLSVAMYLSMRANYATAESAERIYKVLGSEDLSALNSLNSKMMTELKKLDKATTIDLANGLWYDKRYSLKDGVVPTLEDSYRTNIYACDNAKGPTQVRDWVKKKSHGLIDYTPEEFVTILANVLYFKSSWKDKFSEYRTRPDTFYGKNGRTVVEMMHQTEQELFAAGDNFEACKKPFGNEAFNATFVLPNEGVHIDEFTQSLTKEQLAALEFKSYPSALSVPRFELRTDIDSFKVILEKIGLGNLQGLAIKDDIQFVEKIIHKTYLKVDEGGAEVAADTEDEIIAISPNPSGVWEFNLNRPFLIFIHEASTGACILAAKVTDL